MSTLPVPPLQSRRALRHPLGVSTWCVWLLAPQAKVELRTWNLRDAVRLETQPVQESERLPEVGRLGVLRVEQLQPEPRISTAEGPDLAEAQRVRRQRIERQGRTGEVDEIDLPCGTPHILYTERPRVRRLFGQRGRCEIGALPGDTTGFETTLEAVAGLALPLLGSRTIVDLMEPDGWVRRLSTCIRTRNTRSSHGI
jgi:hypothetical protein